ncbi:MAG: hypothetical protein GY941_17595, partial [Planctomycetes bacterium]|nr:hypothetical protein [Planctomycetota bacterium]
MIVKTPLITLSVFASMLLLTLVAKASDDVWTDNFETAKIAAIDEGKDL